MWIQVKGHLQPDVNYRCIPEEEYDALKASHTNLKDTLQLFVGLLEHQGSFIQKRDIERAKQDLKEAEKI